MVQLVPLSRVYWHSQKLYEDSICQAGLKVMSIIVTYNNNDDHVYYDQRRVLFNGVFFSAKKKSPSYKVHEKIADQPCYNVIFYLRTTEHKY